MWHKRAIFITLLILGCEVNQGQSRRAPTIVSESGSTSSVEARNTSSYQISPSHSSTAGGVDSKSESSTTVGPSGNGTTAAGNSTKLATTSAPRTSSRYNYTLANKSATKSPNGTVGRMHVASNLTTARLEHTVRRSTVASTSSANHYNSTSVTPTLATTVGTTTHASTGTRVKTAPAAQPSANSTHLVNSTEPAPAMQLPRYGTPSLPQVTTASSISSTTSANSAIVTTVTTVSNATSVALARDKLVHSATSAGNSTAPESNSFSRSAGNFTVQNVTLGGNPTTVGGNSTSASNAKLNGTLSVHSTATKNSANVTLAKSTSITPANSTLHASISTSSPIHNSALHAHSSSTPHNSTLRVNATAPPPTHNSTFNSPSTAHNSSLPANTPPAFINNSTRANSSIPRNTTHANAGTPTVSNLTLHESGTIPASTQRASTATNFAGNLTTVRPPKPTFGSAGTSSSKMQSPPAKLPTVIRSSTVFNFVVNNTHTGVPCLLSNMSVDLKTLYLKSDQTVSSGTLRVPQTANSSGTCGERYAQLIITWKETEKAQSSPSLINATGHDEESNVLVFNFISDGKRAMLDSIEGSIHLDQHNFPNSAEKTAKGQSAKGLGLFTTLVNTAAYVCNISTNVKAGHIDITIREISIITFNTDIEISGKSVDNCQAQGGLNFVALFGGLFGAALLICIGLFLITRRKKNLYQSSQIP